ncbi:ATP-binding protein [Polaromonas naphthalenivorans]|uniref:AAA ATPase n=1 Tax=Polaromonas naphthalenivorans (strain CJ2) TaxID=365044 RepID=A1VRX5_POLNA|nr:ATP-binding protein [Polaromonas naphthalenivorans]ABM38403.1 AAA ATPase [Polaromonas naphthalenivorans CJ2]
MLTRKILATVRQALSRQASVALIGPRQVGKTTLALQIGEEQNALYLDLEDIQERDKLINAAVFLSAYEDRLVILDEIHRVPDLFLTLRGLIDQGRRRGQRTGRFLLLGSASLDLMRQSGESLAGRISYIDMTPLSVLEVPAEAIENLWVRGGFPDGFLAPGEQQSLSWRKDLLRTYLERDVPMFGARIPAETLRRFWTMLAHNQGSLINASRLAAGLEVSSQTVSRYTDLLVDLLLVRRLQPYPVNVGKRLVKSPKVYIRDSGLLHALLNIADRNALLGHPVVGASWEGFVIENLINAAPAFTVPGFYRTSGGAEIDLLLELPGGERWAIEVKRSRAAKPARGFYEACEDLKPARRFVVHAGLERYPISEDVQAIGVRELADNLSRLEM